ncbi:hypothetical protein ACFV0R_25650 [Streptomyces sp. NPDC059578]|uniref:hypothetical protein n=1 Tax=Streptomyces sp. NPDC059578 TaxID=3346874 RepID=UPI0036A3B5D0
MTDFSNSTFEVAQEIPDEVVLRRAIVHTQGLQPEDLGVLSALLLRDPTLPATLGAIRADLASLGWRMGKDRFTAVVARLKSVGHIAHVPAYDEATQRPTWVTRVYRNPANNRQYVDLGIAESSQVRAESRETRNPADEPSTAGRETRISRGQSRNPENPQSGAESRETRNPADDVSAGQGRNPENPDSASSPPHPPEEVTTSSPNPLTPGADDTSLRSDREGGEAGYAEEDLHAAAELLQLLPAPWTQGRPNARRLAPLLLPVMAREGWPDIRTLSDRDRTALVTQLTKNSHRADNPPALLRRDRIPNLPRYAVVAGAEAGPAGATADGMCPLHPTYRAGNRCIPCVTA